MGAISVAFHPEAEGRVRAEFGIRESGASSEPLKGAVQFLIADGTVVDFPIREAARPVLDAGQSGVASIHKMTSRVPVATLERLAAAKGVTHIRFPLNSGPWTMEFRKSDVRQIPEAARCLLNLLQEWSPPASAIRP